MNKKYYRLQIQVSSHIIPFFHECRALESIKINLKHLKLFKEIATIRLKFA